MLCYFVFRWGNQVDEGGVLRLPHLLDCPRLPSGGFGDPTADVPVSHPYGGGHHDSDLGKPGDGGPGQFDAPGLHVVEEGSRGVSRGHSTRAFATRRKATA
jgi:hypothetical protein